MDVTVVLEDQRKLQRIGLLARMPDRLGTGRCMLRLLDREKDEGKIKGRTVAGRMLAFRGNRGS